MRLAAELAVTRLLSFLLRLAAAPCADWHSLFTSAHCLVNVIRRHGWLSHAVSVKHYEAVWCGMYIIFLFKFLNFFFIEVIEVNASLEVIEVIDICLADAFLAAEYRR
jgi:hypothetical protein